MLVSKFVIKKNISLFLFLITITSVFSQKKMVTPNYLKKGDTVAIVAPAGILKPYRKESVLKAQKLLQSRGLHVVLGENIFNQKVFYFLE